MADRSPPVIKLGAAQAQMDPKRRGSGTGAPAPAPAGIGEVCTSREWGKTSKRPVPARMVVKG